MSDLGPLDPCPFDKRGRHHLVAVLPGDDEHDVTLYCESCGSLRRMPASGSLSTSLDDFDSDAIARLVLKEQP